MQQQSADRRNFDQPERRFVPFLPYFILGQREKTPGAFSPFEPLSEAAQLPQGDMAEANAVCLAARPLYVDGLEAKKGAAPALSPEQLSADYPLFAASLLT